MRFAYMDEAGNTGRRCDDPNQPVHLILSLVIDEAKITAVHEHIREVGRQYCPSMCEATYIAARVRKIRAGIVPADRSAEAVERLWDERIDPYVHFDGVWYPG